MRQRRPRDIRTDPDSSPSICLLSCWLPQPSGEHIKPLRHAADLECDVETLIACNRHDIVKRDESRGVGLDLVLSSGLQSAERIGSVPSGGCDFTALRILHIGDKNHRLGDPSAGSILYCAGQRNPLLRPCR